MKRPLPFSSSLKRRGAVAALVLGTAISTFGSSAAAEASPRTLGDISRYCTACWRNARLHPDSWTDCTQDVFTRLLERVQPQAWDRVLSSDGEERREFLRAIDAVKKRTQRGRRFGAVDGSLVADLRDGSERERLDDRQVVDQVAEELLSARQQQILRLSFEGSSVQAIAEELNLPAERVSDEKYKAIRKLRDHLSPHEQG
jgi:RNA polymerase sigma factor (sigma-70 family)